MFTWYIRSTKMLTFKRSHFRLSLTQRIGPFERQFNEISQKDNDSVWLEKLAKPNIYILSKNVSVSIWKRIPLARCPCLIDSTPVVHFLIRAICFTHENTINDYSFSLILSARLSPAFWVTEMWLHNVSEESVTEWIEVWNRTHTKKKKKENTCAIFGTLTRPTLDWYRFYVNIFHAINVIPFFSIEALCFCYHICISVCPSVANHSQFHGMCYHETFKWNVRNNNFIIFVVFFFLSLQIFDVEFDIVS